MKGSAINLHGTFNPAGAADYDIDIDYTGTTQLSQGFTTTRNKSDGYTSGVKNAERIESDGSVYATFSNGERVLQGKVVLANFASPSGLVTQMARAGARAINPVRRCWAHLARGYWVALNPAR